jgi:putative flippase GtrA
MPKKNHSQFLKFIITGTISNFIAYIFFVVLIYIFHINYKIATSILFLVFLLNNFTLNRFWTFKANSNYKLSFSIFLFFYIVGYFINLFLLKLFVDDFLLPVGYVQACIIPFLAVYYYIVNKYFVHN